MLRIVAISVVVALFAGHAVASAKIHQRPAPSEAVFHFFKFHLRNGSDYTERGIAKRRHLLSSRLYASFQSYFRAEAKFRETRPHDIYFYNGDPFTGCQEGPKWFALGRTRVDRDSAETHIRFYLGSGINAEQRNSVVRMTYERGAWRVDDVVDTYGKTIRQEIAERIQRP